MKQLINTVRNDTSNVIELDTFTRILKQEFFDNEEVRKDFDGVYEYVACAVAGSPVDANVWACVRCTWLNNRRVRWQYQNKVSWATKDQGWI